MQEADMSDRVKSFFETHKASIHLFLVIMNVLIYQGSGCKDVVCCAVIWQKANLRFVKVKCSRSRWFKMHRNNFPSQLETQIPR